MKIKSGKCEYTYIKGNLKNHQDGKKMAIDKLTLFVELSKLPEFKEITLCFMDKNDEVKLSFSSWLMRLETTK